jgi:hypothetical protein
MDLTRPGADTAPTPGAAPAPPAPGPYPAAGPIGRAVLGLALPALAQQYLHLIVRLSDQYLAGHFELPPGADRGAYLSAMTTAGYLYWFVPS